MSRGSRRRQQLPEIRPMRAAGPGTPDTDGVLDHASAPGGLAGWAGVGDGDGMPGGLPVPGAMPDPVLGRLPDGVPAAGGQVDAVPVAGGAADGGSGPSRAVRLASLVPVTVLAGAAGLGFHRVFGWRAVAPTVVVAATVPVLLALAVSGRRRRSPLWPSIVLTAVCWLVLVSATLFRADAAGGLLPTARSLRAATSGLLDSWKLILTTIPPAPADPELLVLVHACVWLAAFTGAEAALRTRAVVLPAFPAFAVFGVALLLGARGDGENLAVAAVLVGVAGLLMLLRAPARPGFARALLSGLPYLACLALVAVLAGPHLPFAGAREPFDLAARTVPPEPVRPPAVSPLDRVSAWLLQPEEPLFTVTAAEAANWRLVVLDRFDGTTWSTTATLARSGGRVPPPTGGSAGGTAGGASGRPAPGRLEQRVTVTGLTGVWLPAADRPASVRAVPGTTLGDVAVDPASGIVAAEPPLRPGTAYQVVSQVPRYRPRALQYAAVSTDPAVRQQAELPAAPDGKPVRSVATMRRLAQEATAGSQYPFQQAVRLAEWLRDGYRYDVRAVPGHAYRNLEFFLETTRRGTSEHFATAYAVMARTLGLPSRVVVGFRPGTRRDGSWQVRAGDVLVWPEVAFSGVGWVPFYPTPGAAGTSGRTAPVPAGQPQERQEIDKQAASQTPPPATPPPAGNPAAEGGDGGGVPWAVIGPSAVAAMLVGYCLVMLALPWRRRRRRQAGNAGQRVVGAWAQAQDRLRDVGLPAGGALTAEEVAAFGSARLGDAAGGDLATLGRLANEVVYGGMDPPPTIADAAWRHCAAVERNVSRSVPRGRRVRLRLDPRAPRVPAGSSAADAVPSPSPALSPSLVGSSPVRSGS